MINYKELSDYDELETLNINFQGKPSKDLETDIYKVYLENPIILELPKSKLQELTENEYQQSVGIYLLNNEDLIEFLDNLDAYIINLSNKHFMKWFGKNIDQKELLKYYENIYDIENDQRVLSFIVNEENELEDLSNYNIDDDLKILVTIKSINIFKQAFKVDLELHSLVQQDTDSFDENCDFIKLIDSQKNMCETNMVDLNTLTKQHKENSLLDEDSNIREEVLELIKTKEMKKKKLLSNSKRVEEANDSLKSQAEDLDNEIKNFKEQLNKL